MSQTTGSPMPTLHPAPTARDRWCAVNKMALVGMGAAAAVLAAWMLLSRVPYGGPLLSLVAFAGLTQPMLAMWRGSTDPEKARSCRIVLETLALNTLACAMVYSDNRWLHPGHDLLHHNLGSIGPGLLASFMASVVIDWVLSTLIQSIRKNGVGSTLGFGGLALACLGVVALVPFGGTLAMLVAAIRGDIVEYFDDIDSRVVRAFMWAWALVSVPMFVTSYNQSGFSYWVTGDMLVCNLFSVFAALTAIFLAGVLGGVAAYAVHAFYTAMLERCVQRNHGDMPG